MVLRSKLTGVLPKKKAKKKKQQTKKVTRPDGCSKNKTIDTLLITLLFPSQGLDGDTGPKGLAGAVGRTGNPVNNMVLVSALMTVLSTKVNSLLACLCTPNVY